MQIAPFSNCQRSTFHVLPSPKALMSEYDNPQKPLRRAVFKGIRSSKFRHVYGSPAKRPRCYENVRITRNAHDSAFCAANPKFIAVVVEVGGGGSFVVLPLDRVGRTDYMAPKVRKS